MTSRPMRIPALSSFVALALLAVAGPSLALDLDGARGETAFFLLGMLQEGPQGRPVTADSDEIEYFTCNQHVIAFVFRDYLARFVREQALDTEIRTEWRSTCVVAFRSRELVAALASLYTRAGATMKLDAAWLESQPREHMAAYVAGALLRWGDRDAVAVPRAAHKRALLKSLLQHLDSGPVMEMNRELLFHPSDILATAVSRHPGPEGLAAADSLLGLASADDLAIYPVVIDAARTGAFDGRRLETPCVTLRATLIPMPPVVPMSGLEGALAEAHADFVRVNGTSVSVRDVVLPEVQIVLTLERRAARPYVWLSRVGYDAARRTAATLVTYGTDAQPRPTVVAVFLERGDSGWNVVHFALQEALLDK